MKKAIILLVFLLLEIHFGKTQTPCSFEATVERMKAHNPNIESELSENEVYIKQFINQLKAEGQLKGQTDFQIPVVLHVFHIGEDGKIDMDQAHSGLKVLNDDFNGRNEGWNSIDPVFDSIKSSINIEFCLATIDPEGNPTTGVNYYEDEAAFYNDGDVFRYAWDNFKYFNVFMPKYVFGEPSNFTAYAYYPNLSSTMANRDGIFYSSIRWGYGKRSELDEGQDWASVVTHEVGHWLNLRHTFSGGCGVQNDFVDDTPPTLGGEIELSGCNNNDFSCGVKTNGSNYMDYNHDCKKMFTQGQVDRMLSALYHPARIQLWSPENLAETGCAPPPTKVKDLANELNIKVYPNPSDHQLHFEVNEIPAHLTIFDVNGKVVLDENMETNRKTINTSTLNTGIHFYQIRIDSDVLGGKVLIK